MTTSPPRELLGAQTPRVSSVPPYSTTAGDEAIELAASAGLHLDPWQQLVLRQALGERPDGKWSAFEVGLVVPRQNGKGSILEARELAGLFLFDEKLIIHSAHLFDTSMDHMRRIMELIESTPDLDRRVKRVSRSHGEEGVELRTGQRLRFKTRTKGGGRGLTGDVVVLDEAYNLPEAVLSALMPTMAAKSKHGNPQLWFASSAVDQVEHPDGHVLARVRRRGLQGDPALGYFEWSVDEELYNPEDPDPVATDPKQWAIANPGMGLRITEEYIGREQRSMGAKGFAVERLSIGDWPSEEDAASPIPYVRWQASEDPDSQAGDPVALAVAVSKDRAWSSIAAAGRRSDGRLHAVVIEYRPGTDWVVARLAELVAKWNPCAVGLLPDGPEGSLLKAMAEEGIETRCRCHGALEVQQVAAREFAQACGDLYDQIVDDKLRHTGQGHLDFAVKKAVPKPNGDGGWSFSRKLSSVDISPLIAVTVASALFAEHGHQQEYDLLESIW